MSKFEKVHMRGVDHVTGTIARNIDVESARLSLENKDEKGTMVINVSKKFFFNDKGTVLSHSVIHTNCAAISSDYGYDKFALA